MFTVFTAECVAIVTVNLLSIILFIKNKSLRTRSMYLAMSLTVADLLVGSVSGSVDSFLGQNGLCPFVKFYLVSSEVRIAFDYLILFFSGCLHDKHCYDFFRAISRHVSSI